MQTLGLAHCRLNAAAAIGANTGQIVSLAHLRRIMSRLSLFSSPLLLGFEHFEDTLERISKMPAEGYPPYNIEQIGTDKLRITLAVAGFTDKDLSIQVEDNQLTIHGTQQDDRERRFLHRGIAARQFRRSFVLANGIEVESAALDNGLLNIDLQRPKPDARVKTIKIERMDRDSTIDLEKQHGR